MMPVTTSMVLSLLVGGISYPCTTEGDCVPGLRCVPWPASDLVCALPCTCANNERCPQCKVDGLFEAAKPYVPTCFQGYCSLSTAY